MADEEFMNEREESPSVYFVLDGGRLLEAAELSASLTISEEKRPQTETITVRIPNPDAVLNMCMELFAGKNVLGDSGLHELILRHLGNPESDTPEMWYVLDWVRLLRLANSIQSTILRDQPVNLDTDVLYTKQGAQCVQGTTPDSPERQQIEDSLSRKNGSTSRLKLWSDPVYAIRQYFANLYELGSLTENQAKAVQTSWGMLREVAAMDGVLELNAEELFGRATYHPFPIIIPFDPEEAWEWRCQELDSLDDFDQKLGLMVKEAMEKAIQNSRDELSGLIPKERLKKEDKLRRLGLFVEDPQSLSLEEREPFEDGYFCISPKKVYFTEVKLFD